MVGFANPIEMSKVIGMDASAPALIDVTTNGGLCSRAK
jgi:hypothetical protein